MTDRVQILVAEDDAALRALLVRELEDEGYRCIGAASLAEARRVLQEVPEVSLLVLDLYLPDGTALDLLRELPRYSLRPALILTGAPSLDSAVSAMQLGVIDYVTKPPVDLLERVARALGVAHERRAMLAAQQGLREWGQWMDELGKALTGQAPIPATPRLPREPARSGAPALDESILGRLTEREREVALAFFPDRTAQEIANALGISIHTVQNHFRSIYNKLGVSSRLELVQMMTEAPR